MIAVTHLREFIDEIVRTSGTAREAVEAEFKSTALGAATAVFGTETPIAVELIGEFDEIRFFQLVRGARVPIFYNPSERYEVERVEKEFGKDLPLPVHSLALQQELARAMQPAVLRYFPGPVFPDGSLGALLASGGGWMRGLSAKRGRVEIVVERTYLTFQRLRLNGGSVEYGHELVVREDGVEKARKTLLSDGTEDAVRSWGSLPASGASKPVFVTLLRKIAADPEDAYASRNALLSAAIDPPIRGGFWEWTHAVLPGLLSRFEFSPPTVGLGNFGNSYVRIDGEFIDAGAVTSEALQLRGPESEDERRDLERIVALYVEWLDGDFRDGGNRFELVQFLEQRLRWGPPGKVPVPSFDDATLERGAQAVKPVKEAKRDHVLALFSAEDWTIVLRDDTKGSPFGSYCGIELVPPEGGEPIPVMVVDAWNPPARAILDGDTFAFRRFTTWLREAIVRGGHDKRCKFRRKSIALSDWLHFEIPDTGDRFLVDWRAQWYVARAGFRVENFASIYAYSNTYIEMLRSYAIPQWRRFLREVMDPRFAYEPTDR